MSRSDLVDIECKVVVRRDKAIAVVDGTVLPTTGLLKWFWLPVSQVEENDDGTITLPEWLAIEKGLV